jgi:hypothetical protein
VAFFQAEHSPCFVPRELLFQLQSDSGLRFGDDEEFKSVMERQDVTVDCLLEKIFSAGQVLAINHADVLFPAEQLGQSAVQPNPEQIQHTMFQCVTCAALLVVAYIAARWQIPPEKLRLIITTIFKTNPSKFISAQTVMSNAQGLLIECLVADQS